MTRYDPFAYGEVRLDPNKQKQEGALPPDSDDLLFAEGESVKQAPPADSSWDMMADEDVDGLLPGASPDAGQAVEFGAEILGEGTPSDMPFDDPMSGDGSLSMSDLEDASPNSQPLPEMMGDGQPAGTMDHLLDQPMDDFDAPAVPEQPAAHGMPAAAAPTQSLEPETTESTPQPRKRREVRRRRIAPTEGEAPLAPEGSLAAAQKAKEKSAALPGKRRMPALAAFVPLVVCAGGGTAASWFWVMQENPVMGGIIGAATLVSALFSWLLLRG